MFQTYDDFGGPAHTAGRVAALRAELERRSLDAFILPSTDEFQNETVPPSAQRLLWLTGFSGSWGVSIIMAEKAVLFADGRYALQARSQADGAIFSILKFPETKPAQWLEANLQPGMRAGYDPWLHTPDEVKALSQAASKAGATLEPAQNPIDAIWAERPGAPCAPARLHPPEFAGETAADKLAAVQAELKRDGDDAAILASPASIAWFFNLRGGDIAHTPLALGYAIVHAARPAQIFMDERKTDAALRGALSDYAEFSAIEALETQLHALNGKTVRVDPAHTPEWFASQLSAAGAVISEGQDPCLLRRARKNPAEIKGARLAHLRDGAAVVNFLAWLDAEADGGKLDEISAAEKLEDFRRQTGFLRDISFATIAGAGPNGAIVHYRPARSSNRKLELNSLFLIDSGGQYEDGTTDITRTVAIGEPTHEMRRHFTLVLKGHIAIATAYFPAGTRGVDLDPFARRALWEAGCDYDHGTGHGVGSYLSVHEGPQSISRRGMAALEPGMIVSNEPGYYREGAYGIRIENLMLVAPLAPVPGGDREMMRFEILTLAPIDRRLIARQMLSPFEAAWLDAYHARVGETLAPLLPEGAKSWLMAVCKPLAP